ncbi:MAG: DNA polymerase III subunit epsilon [Acidithiobacillus sp.]|nr:DNA polymerase III subunit epsilon [Acidithiobacillus sp.]
MVVRELVVDTETTGIDPRQGHRIIEIGVVEIVDRRLTGNDFHVYLNPDRPSEPGALAVHGLTEEFLQDKARFPEIVAELLAYLGEDTLIIHNAPFDLAFFQAELERVGRPPLPNPIIDTLLDARKRHPGQKNDLDSLCRRYGVDNRHRTRHGALLDCELLAQVYLAMTGGQVELESLMETGSSVGGDREGSFVPQPILRKAEGVLRVQLAREEELAEHQAYLQRMGNALWQDS